MMLPQMEQFKVVVFTQELSYSISHFFLLGRSKKLSPLHAYDIKGSLGEKKDMASALQAFLEINRDAEKIVIWLDNCSSQNKNWALFSHLVGVVSSNVIQAKSIELNYLEPSHTFMSADNCHHQLT